MAYGYLSDDIKIVTAIDATAGLAAATALNGAVVDTQGYAGCLMIATFGAIVATAVTSIKAQQDTDVAMGAAADIAGTGQTVTDADDGKTFCIDILRPRERYLRIVVSRGTANATVSAVYILYRGRNKPAVQAATILVEKFTGPAEGAA